jgi:anthranilate synthase component 2/putative glutamine amidotransferase
VASSASEGRRPRIGLSTYLEDASWGTWRRPAAVVGRVYLDAVARAGGTPLLLPPVGTDESVVGALDGLMLIGGADITPAAYGAEPHPETVLTRPDRDEHERRLLMAALDRDLPVLGICRGAQLLTVALGGTVRQHLPGELGHTGHRPEVGVFGTTRVTTRPGSVVAEVLGEEATVPCYHHQGLSEAGSPLVPTAWAEDGLVEAVELPGNRRVLGVQWHPEEEFDDLRLFEWLTGLAKRAEATT